MNLADYHAAAMRTKADYDTPNDQLLCAVLGLVGESGELAEVLKKAKYQGHDLSTDKLVNELGDVLWYWHLAVDAIEYISPDTVARMNIEKLRQRYPEGFDSERSRERGS